MTERGSRSSGPIALGVVLAALIVVSTAGGTGFAPLDSAVASAEDVTGRVLSTFGAAGAEESAADRTPGREIDTTRVETAIHREVNARREAAGVAPLVHRMPLRRVARAHSRTMAEEGYVGHRGPDGRTLADRYARADYRCDSGNATGGENLLRLDVGSTEVAESAVARRAVTSWMNSRTHRQRILSDEWREEGVGVAVATRSDRTLVYVTQTFC